MRFSPPGRELLMQTPRLDMWVAGAEANVMTALARLGHHAALVSAVPDNALGDAAITALRAQGVDVAGIGRAPGRMATYYVIAGAGLRPSEVIYDRAHSSFQGAAAGGWDWPALFANAGRLHLSGITPALGEPAARAALAAARAANAMGLSVSFDGNYRSRLWEGQARNPAEILRELVAEADILFGDYRDISLLLGRPVAGERPEDRRAAAEAAFAAFDRLQLIASTIRRADYVDSNRLSARIDTRGEHVETAETVIPGIVDRVGTGDAFAAGILHGLAEKATIAEVATCGLSLAALKHSLPGDASLFTQRDLKAFMAGGSDIRR